MGVCAGVAVRGSRWILRATGEITMSDPDWMRAKQIFNEVLERNGSERRAFLAAACGSDAELHSRVEALLAADERAGQFLESPTGEGAQAAAREIANQTNG